MPALVGLSQIPVDRVVRSGYRPLRYEILHLRRLRSVGLPQRSTSRCKRPPTLRIFRSFETRPSLSTTQALDSNSEPLGTPLRSEIPIVHADARRPTRGCLDDVDPEVDKA